jgi:precorrin-6B methylase 2
MQFLLTTVLRLERHEVFLDVGHGAGNTCLQAAYTIGCEARGIEGTYELMILHCTV